MGVSTLGTVATDLARKAVRAPAIVVTSSGPSTGSLGVGGTGAHWS